MRKKYINIKIKIINKFKIMTKGTNNDKTMTQIAKTIITIKYINIKTKKKMISNIY